MDLILSYLITINGNVATPASKKKYKDRQMYLSNTSPLIIFAGNKGLLTIKVKRASNYVIIRVCFKEI